MKKLLLALLLLAPSLALAQTVTNPLIQKRQQKGTCPPPATFCSDANDVGDEYICTAGAGATYVCNTVGAGGGTGTAVGGSSAFSAITGSTNTTAAMVVGAGASLAPTSTGTITSGNLLTGTLSTCGAGTAGKIRVPSGSVPMRYCNNAATPALGYIPYGDSSGNANNALTADLATTASAAFTADALSGDPTDCSAGQYASAIDSSGNLTCSTPGSGVYLPLAGGTMTGDVTMDPNGDDLVFPVAASAATPAPSLRFNTTGMEPSPWRTFIHNAGIANHDHVYTLTYNGSYSDSGGAVRDDPNSHYIQWNHESRFHNTDPNSRGYYEWNLNLDPNIGTASVSTIRPLSFAYDMDGRKTLFDIGVNSDPNSGYFTMSSGMTFVTATGSSFIVAGRPVTNPSDPNETNRITLAPSNYYDGADRAPVIAQTDGYFKINSGRSAYNGTARPLALNYDHAGQVWLSGAPFFEPGQVLLYGEQDVIQFHVRGYSTQTNDIVLIENSGGTDLFAVANTGTLYVIPQASAPGSCSQGQIYMDTSGAYCVCTATNTWTNTTGVGTCV